MVTVFAGSFDPFTLGHYEVVLKASKIFDKVIVAVAHNNSKNSSLSLQDRMDIVKLSVNNISNVIVESFNGALTDYAKVKKCNHLVRGLRNTNDFVYEKDLCAIYGDMDNKLEQVFFMSSPSLSHVSSSVVKELVQLKKDVSGYVCKDACDKILEYYSK